MLNDKQIKVFVETCKNNKAYLNEPRDNHGRWTKKKVFQEQENKENCITFNNNEEILDFFEGNGLNADVNEKWLNSLSEEQKSSLLFYTTERYRKINEAIRKNLRKIIQKYKQQIYNIDNAINSYELKTSIYVYRGVSEKFLETNNLKKGDIFFEKAYLSTSPSKDIKQLNRSVVFKIKIPKGKGLGAWINQVSKFKNEEYEFLLKKDTKFSIISIEKQNNKTYIEMEMENDNER